MTDNHIRQLQETIALRVLPEIKTVRRATQAALVWSIATAVLMLSGWVVALTILWWGVTH